MKFQIPKCKVIFLILLLQTVMHLKAVMGEEFLYFSYGSNLLAERIHINNPSAVRAGIGKLKDYEIDFVTYSRRWKGCSATIVEKNGSYVWGALWKINLKDMEHLDRQEGVPDNLYVPLTVDVFSPTENRTVSCRTYKQTAITPFLDKIENLPEDRRPSGPYLKTILNGAEESGLPKEYQEFLKRIPNNGYNGKVDIGLDLKLK